LSDSKPIHSPIYQRANVSLCNRPRVRVQIVLHTTDDLNKNINFFEIIVVTVKIRLNVKNWRVMRYCWLRQAYWPLPLDFILPTFVFTWWNGRVI